MGTIVKSDKKTPGIVRHIPVSRILKYEQLYISELLLKEFTISAEEKLDVWSWVTPLLKTGQSKMTSKVPFVNKALWFDFIFVTRQLLLVSLMWGENHAVHYPKKKSLPSKSARHTPAVQKQAEMEEDE